MLDFLEIERETKRDGHMNIIPTFNMYPKPKDLLVRGGDFYAVWDEEQKLWSTDEDAALALIDNELRNYILTHPELPSNTKVMYMKNSSTKSVDTFHHYIQSQLRDNYVPLDESLVFANTEVTRDMYASKRLSYPLKSGSHASWDKLIGTLYSPEERHKIEWAIGAIVSGDSRWIQKFLVFYGAAGTGKSTIINIIQKLFDGYWCAFDAKALGSNNSQFSLEPFKNNPLIAIQHDGDLSRIEDNARLNSLVSHEVLNVNTKNKSIYEQRFKAFLIMGTNRPVKITEAKSGLLRRLIDVHPSGKKLPGKEYRSLVKKVEFELGAIAHYCLGVYEENPGYYDDYVPKAMMSASNDFYDFVCDTYSTFKKSDSTTLKSAWAIYNTYCDEAHVVYRLSRRPFKEELKNYFWNYDEVVVGEDGSKLRNYYSGFRTDIFDDSAKEEEATVESDTQWLEFNHTESIFDAVCSECPAQYASDSGKPVKKWDKVKSKLSDIDTSKVHYVKVPDDHIVIDFDKKDKDGNKSFELNLEAANKFPSTYAELSKSGGGIHLHYIYNGDPSKLSRIYGEDIEVKVFTGGSSLRRKLTKCNALNIAVISSGLPLKKGGKAMLNRDGFKSERSLRKTIMRHINKEIMHNTAPSVQMIAKCLDEAYESGLHYDVSDLENSVYALAASSTNQASACLKLVNKMHFKSEGSNETQADAEELVFFDCEVFPNLFLICWKFAGYEKPTVKMINPRPTDIETLLKYRLIGFNCRRYDNHLLWACLMGYTNQQLYDLSQRIINSPKGSGNRHLFGEAYNLSYTDIYDFASAGNKKSLKKFEIEMSNISFDTLKKKGYSDEEIKLIKAGTHHQELGIPWDEPVDERLWDKVAEYCENDVIATEAAFHYLKGDWIAREIMADLTGMTVNDTTNSLSTRFIFGKEQHPELIYTDLATGKQFDMHGNLVDSTADVINAFSSYEYAYSEKDKKYHNMYRGTDLGRGGYILSNPGIYGNVALLDIQSLHPHSIIAMNYFGEYTQRYNDIMNTRLLIKHGDYESAKKMMGGQLAKYLTDISTAKDLSNAMKTILNSCYGLTSASFDNAMKHPMNKNNIVALRGALFMRTLQDEIESRGYKITSIKTDSVKIADADRDIVEFCMEFAKKYSYSFEFEACYDRICQLNDADYVARYKDADWCQKTFGTVPGDNKKHAGEWTVTGKRFAIPYVFKTLFSHEPITFSDLCTTFSVQTALYLDMNEALPDVSAYEKEFEKIEDKYKKGLISDTTFESTCKDLNRKIEEGHDYHFVGRVGQFVPISPGMGGGLLVAKRKNKYDSANGAKGFRWMESEIIREANEDSIDMSYFQKMADESIELISSLGDFEWFVSDDPYISKPKDPFSDCMNIPIDADEEVPF